MLSKNLNANTGSSITERLQEVQKKINDAESRAGRAPGSVTLIAVSKLKMLDAILAVANAGVVHFGENYVQEATKKMEKIKNSNLGSNIKWHLIGALQTNKSKFVVGKFETIQSVDRIELARALDARAQEACVVQNVLIQVKLGDEPTKCGALISGAPDLIQKVVGLKNLRVEGLMALPPIEAEAEASRKYFVQLRELKKEWAKFVPSASGSFQHLSMGTTHDYEIAIEEGATMVRVGTAVFGPRDTTEI